MKYLVIENRHYSYSVQNRLYTKEEILKEFFGVFMKYDEYDSYYGRVRNIEEGIESIKEYLCNEYRFDEEEELIEYIIEEYGSLEFWEKKVINENFFHGLDPRLDIYEIEKGGNLKRIKPEEL